LGVTAKTTLGHAQGGDPGAFEELVTPYCRELRLHCYRILGSFSDAEDVLQETLVSAWQALAGFDGRSFRAWLYRIATNRCLNHRRAASRRPTLARWPDPRSSLTATTADKRWRPEPSYGGLIDGVAMGPEARYDVDKPLMVLVVAGLRRLTPRQSAVLVLHGLLGFSVAEVADMLQTTCASVNSTLQRARHNLRPSQNGPFVATRRSSRDDALVDRFVDAYERGDIRLVIAVLTGTDERELASPTHDRKSALITPSKEVRRDSEFRGRTSALAVQEGGACSVS
jgi:RNA polymerase sigma-70 factor (ECF subfamily)